VTLVSTFLALTWTARADQRQEWSSELRHFLATRYGSVEASPISTGILYDLVLPMSGIGAFDGREASGTANTGQWRQMAHELKRATLGESSLPPDTTFREWGREAQREHVYPLAILFYHYRRIRPGLPQDSVFRSGPQGIAGIREDAFEEAQAFAAASLHAWTYRGEEVRFRLDLPRLYFSNDPRAVKSIEADFGDGSGLRPVQSPAEIPVHYSEIGSKTIRLRVTLSDGTELYANTLLDVRSLRTPSPTDTLHLQASLSYNGEYATGDAYVYLADGHSSVTKPVIVSEGFDLDNTMYWDELYALLNQQEMLETMRAMGYDAVVLNYTNATMYLQSNAFLVETLIDSVNHLIDPSRTTTVVGPSMGGLTTRYALTHMEANSDPHRVRTWISFDSPQNGANIPLSIQYWVDFFADQSADAAALRDALNSPAARQMLLAHFTTPPSNVATSDPMFSAFHNELSQLGEYPSLPRKVAIANGSGHQVGMDFNPGDQLIYYQYRSWFVDINGNCWALHNTQPQLIFQGMINQIWPFPDTYENVTVQPTWPWDNAPGGKRSSMAQMDSVAVPYGDIIALHQSHCFIPTISALGLAVSDPFYDIAGDPDLYSLTVFDSLYFPTENQGHVDITPENYWWFLQEAVDSLPAPVVVIQQENSQTHLHWPRVAGARSYQVHSTNDVDTWPPQYALTSDTTWIDADTSSVRQFYEVEASMELSVFGNR
jgi:pimeloyl-ACP methyl ester carboxylesterase